MNFDIGPMPSTALPIALLAGPQPSEEFAALLELGGAPARASVLIESASTTPVAEPVETSIRPRIISTIAPVTDPAILQADALVSALMPEAESPKAPTDPITPLHIPVALPPMPRQPARCLAPLPPEAAEDALKEQDETDERSDTTHEDEPVANIVSAILAAPTPIVGQASSTLEPIPASNAALTDTPQEAIDNPARTTLSRGALTTPRPTLTEIAASPFEHEAEEFVAETADAPTPRQSVEPQPEPIANTKPASLALEPVDLQADEAQPESELKINPAPAQPDPVDVEAVQAETGASDLVIAEGRPIRTTAPKLAPARATKVADIAVTIADIPAPFVATPVVNKAFDLAMTPASAAQITSVPTSAVDTVIDRQLDLVRNEQWLGELAHDIAKAADSNDRLSFRLMPHQLGRLDIDVSRSHNGVSLMIRTESDSTQSILTAAQPRLAEELRAQGVKIADTQMFSGDASHSHHRDNASRPVSLIETFTAQPETADAPDQVQRDGRYA